MRESGLSPAEHEPMVQALYAPVADWIEQRRRDFVRRPLVVGISGPQGGGKSTLARALLAGARDAGQRAVTVSTDDFYLTRRAQIGLRERNPDCRYLRQRGYPGTHDVRLGTAVLHDLRAGRRVALPRYDKSAHGGEGDRSPRVELAEARLDLVLFEGWTLGFEPRTESHALDAEMRTVDRLLSAYAPWNAAVDVWILLRARVLDDIVRWRVQSELQRAARGQATMGEAAARRYAERCLPAYRVYVPPLWDEPAPAPTLRVWLGSDRRPSPPLTRSC